MVRVLFLDIDGCLNWSPAADSLYFMSNEELQQYYWNLAHLNKHIPIVDDNLAALQHIVNEVLDLKIVWSTDWRFDKDDKYASKFGWHNPKLWLETLPWLSERVIGMTPKKMSSNRCEEIHFWFNENATRKKYADKDWLDDKHSEYCFFKDKYYDIANYAIIDDYDSYCMNWYGKHFFKCDPNKGLTREQADNIIAYLKTNDFDEKELDWRKNDK